MENNCSKMVSVIIPGFRHAPYLKARIESVLRQDYDNFEVIMLDDCSPDESASIMLAYKDHPHVSHVVINETNSGNTFLQWQKGIALAQGEYVWIAESDDVASPRFLSSLMARATACDAVCAYAYSTLIDHDGNTLPEDPNRPWMYRHPGIYEGMDFVRTHLSLTTLIFNASMAVWKRTCFDHVDKRFMSHRHCGDWMFWVEICRQGKVVVVPELLNFFRQHQQKVTVESLKTGDNYRELAPIQQHVLATLRATPYQRRVVRGRMSQRLRRNAPKAVSRELQKQYPDVYGASLLDLLCYLIDKKLNISGFQYAKGALRK